jgi:hypothetical protein
MVRDIGRRVLSVVPPFRAGGIPSRYESFKVRPMRLRILGQLAHRK